MKRIACWGAVILWAGGLPATGAVPLPERIAEATAATNVSARRTQPLQLAVRVQVGERPAVAAGLLLVDPAGFARLELRGAEGLVERHLMRGGETRAARGGQLLDEHRFFLPPLYVLQARDGEALRAALEGLGVRVDSVGLAECGEGDCLVVGDAGREIPRRLPPPVLGLDLYEAARALHADEEAAEAAGMTLEEWQAISEAQEWGEVGAVPIDDLAAEGDPVGELLEAPPVGPERLAEATPSANPNSAGDEARPEGAVKEGAAVVEEGLGVEEEVGPAGAPGDDVVPEEAEALAVHWPGLWIDRGSFAIRGMDASGGTRIRLGPDVLHGAVRVPAWISIEEPGREAVRLEVVAASPAKPGPEAFDPAWLMLSEPLRRPLSSDSAGTDKPRPPESSPPPKTQ